MRDFTYILGPCGMDSEEMYLETGQELDKLMQGRDWFYKASFDKANRTSIVGDRCIGLDEALPVFKEIKKLCPNIKLVTDVHECCQIEKLQGVIDCIQIPAFLCRQTDLVVECAKAFDIVFVKKMQWLGPENVIKSVDKIKGVNPNCKAWLGDRGTNLGYDKLIVDFTIVDEIKKHYDKFILDCTHSVQRSRRVYGNQGDVRVAERYFKTAPIFNYDGAFAEVHPCPSESASDKDTQFVLEDFPELLNYQDEVLTLG